MNVEFHSDNFSIKIEGKQLPFSLIRKIASYKLVISFDMNEKDNQLMSVDLTCCRHHWQREMLMDDLLLV